MKPFIDSRDAEIAQILPTPAEDIELKKLYQNYLKFESTSKTLQQEKNLIDLSDARELFDSLIEQIGKLHPGVHYLDNTEKSICRYVAFENAIITALNQLPLTAEQEDLLHVFNPSMEVETADTTASFEDQVLAKKRKKAGFCVSNLRWIPCTSNVAERLFSSLSYVLTHFRAKISPVNLESQIFLMFNRCFWSECTIDETVN